MRNIYLVYITQLSKGLQRPDWLFKLRICLIVIIPLRDKPAIVPTRVKLSGNVWFIIRQLFPSGWVNSGGYFLALLQSTSYPLRCINFTKVDATPHNRRACFIRPKRPKFRKRSGAEFSGKTFRRKGITRKVVSTSQEFGTRKI